jgi:hypothetical protein
MGVAKAPRMVKDGERTCALFQRANPHVVNGTVVLRQRPVCPAFPAGYIAP